MSVQIIPEIKHLRYIRKPLAPPGTKNLAYTYALAAMDILEDRIKFSSFMTSTGKPIKDLYGLICAVEAGEWGR